MRKISFLPCYVVTEQAEACHAVGRCAGTVGVQHTFHHCHFDIALPHSKAFSMLVTDTSVFFSFCFKFPYPSYEKTSQLLVSFHFITPPTSKPRRGIQPPLLNAVDITRLMSSLRLGCLAFISWQTQCSWSVSWRHPQDACSHTVLGIIRTGYLLLCLSLAWVEDWSKMKPSRPISNISELIRYSKHNATGPIQHYGGVFSTLIDLHAPLPRVTKKIFPQAS